MNNRKELGIFMDHASAHLMEPGKDNNINTINSEFTHNEKERSLQNGESTMQNTKQQLESAYYEKIGEAILNYDKVLLFGPTKAKEELQNVLRENDRFNNVQIELKQADKMTENQQHAFVRDYFSNN